MTVHTLTCLTFLTGLVLLPSFITPEEQRRLVRWSLQDHARYPNETNLDTHYIIPEEGLWKLYQRSKLTDTPIDDIQPRALSSSSSSVQADLPGPRQLISNEPADKSNYLSLTTESKSPAQPSTTVKPASVASLIPKLRWANVGWFYHWGTKHYDFTRGKIEVSEVYKDVCKRAVRAVPWGEVFDRGRQENEWGDDDWSLWNESYGENRLADVLLLC